MKATNTVNNLQGMDRDEAVRQSAFRIIADQNARLAAVLEPSAEDLDVVVSEGLIETIDK